MSTTCYDSMGQQGPLVAVLSEAIALLTMIEIKHFKTGRFITLIF